MLLAKAANDNMEISVNRIGKEIGIATRYAMSASVEDFNKWLRE
jgi:hypothetical protein